jgi:hypothetical protein
MRHKRRLSSAAVTSLLVTLAVVIGAGAGPARAQQYAPSGRHRLRPHEGGEWDQVPRATTPELRLDAVGQSSSVLGGVNRWL